MNSLIIGGHRYQFLFRFLCTRLRAKYDIVNYEDTCLQLTHLYCVSLITRVYLISSVRGYELNW